MGRNEMENDRGCNDEEDFVTVKIGFDKIMEYGKLDIDKMRYERFWREME